MTTPTTRTRSRLALIGTRQERGYDAAWYARVEVAKRAEPWCHAPRCSSPDDAGTPANPLTGDHPIELSAGGSRDQEPVIVCRRDNSSKAAKRTGWPWNQ